MQLITYQMSLILKTLIWYFLFNDMMLMRFKNKLIYYCSYKRKRSRINTLQFATDCDVCICSITNVPAWQNKGGIEVHCLMLALMNMQVGQILNTEG